MNLSAAYLKKIEEAKSEGRIESHIEIAQRLLRENSSLEFISRVTDLPIATLQQLQRSL
jgi:predicted transposase YdaD